MRSRDLRSTNWYGPAQTVAAANSPTFSPAALGDTIMPARSLRLASSGTKGSDRLNLTLSAASASTLAIGASSALRLESGMVFMRSLSKLPSTLLLHASYGAPVALPSDDKTSTSDSICKYCEQTTPYFVIFEREIAP